jgi:hypothetical protein
MKWIKRILGITELLIKQKETNTLLKVIAHQTKRNADLQESYNKAYHIK